MITQLTKKEWAEFVGKNSDNSYSLAICLATMLLWEEPDIDSHEVLEGLGLSGAQAEMAIGYARNNNLLYNLSPKENKNNEKEN